MRHTMSSKRAFMLFVAVIVSFGAVFAASNGPEASLGSRPSRDPQVSRTSEPSGTLEFRTAHFTIVYEPECMSSAKLIADGCETEYEYLCSLFGVDPGLSIPVVVTSHRKVLNAYYTSYPSNRIVLYDTVADNDELSVFPETLLYVFRHELAHAFTMNIRSPFWQAVSSVFGDSVSVSPALYAYESLAEGVAVLSESLDGYGRLNDLRSMRIVRQAKIEGRFPSWIDIAGAMDVHPSSSLPYMFGGAFLSYLCDEYGRSAVYEVFEWFGRVNWLRDAAGVIEDCIGVPFEGLWQGFYDSIEVPSSFVEASFLTASLSGVPSVGGFAQRGRFRGLAVGGDGEVYLLDRASSGLYRISEHGYGDCRRLASISTYGQGLSVSSDGYAMVPYIANTSSCVKVFDHDGRQVRSFSFDDRDVRGGCFVEFHNPHNPKEGTASDGLDGKHVVLYTSKGQETFVELCDADGTMLYSIPLGKGSIASGFSAIGGGKVAFILTRQGRDFFAVLDVGASMEGMTLSIAEAPDSIRLTSMSCGVDGDGHRIVSFSWFPNAACLDGSSSVDDVPVFGGYGEFSPDTWTIRLSYANLLGGVGFPVRVGDEVIFSSSLYDGDLLSSVAVETLGLGDPTALEPLSFTVPCSYGDVESFMELSSPYSAVSNLGRGTLLPFGVYGPLSAARDMGLGLTWYSSDPTGAMAVTASGLYAGSGPSVWLDVSLHGGLLDVGGGFKAVVDRASKAVDSYVATVHAGLALEFEVGNERRVSIEDRFFADWNLPRCGDGSFEWSNSLSVLYSYAIGTGLGKTDVFGYAFGVGLDGFDPSATCLLVLPRLIPVRCEGRLAFNLPLRLEFGARYSVRARDVVLAGSAKATLLSYEIQRGVRVLGLYFKRVVLDARYSAAYAVVSQAFSHSLGLQAFVELSPVLGLYATQLSVDLGAKLSFDLKGGLSASLLFSLK